jgi:5'-deoxynucleotidase YfbR-like HD superfamily hydrolase
MDESIQSFLSFRSLWSNAQEPMSAITRWGKFPRYGQTLTEHSNSVPLVGWWVMSKLPHDVFVELNRELVLLALMVHDHGEPRHRGDVPYDDKRKIDDLLEWNAFKSMVRHYTLSPFREMVEDAFLLQFCRNSEICQFLKVDQDRIRDLQQTFAREAAVFEFTERIDYFLSASIGKENGIHNDVETMMEGTLRNQTEPMAKLVDEFPMFEVIWTSELFAWFHSDKERRV